MNCGTAGFSECGRISLMTTLRNGLGVNASIWPGRSAHHVADVPGARVAFAIGRIGQHDGMSRAIGRHRPGINIGIRHRQQHIGLFIQQFERLGMFEAAGVGPKDIGVMPIDTCDVLRRSRQRRRNRRRESACWAGKV